MKAPAVFSAFIALLFGAAAASAATSAITLQGSTLTFKQAIATCPGALGTVTFSLGHSRVASLPGVSDQIDTSSSGIDTITFTNDKTGKTAVVTANGHKSTVSAKNVQVKWHDQLACVMPD
ncbi:MAG: hypothetical protein ABI231_01005 [Candidatus Tumulicola sp.]